MIKKSKNQNPRMKIDFEFQERILIRDCNFGQIMGGTMENDPDFPISDIFGGKNPQSWFWFWFWF
jgi:hypothetical protein